MNEFEGFHPAQTDRPVPAEPVQPTSPAPTSPAAPDLSAQQIPPAYRPGGYPPPSGYQTGYPVCPTYPAYPGYPAYPAYPGYPGYLGYPVPPPPVPQAAPKAPSADSAAPETEPEEPQASDVMEGQLSFEEPTPPAAPEPSGETIQFDPLKAAPPSGRQKNSGLRAFCAILALLVLACGCLTGGYYLGGAKSAAALPSETESAPDIPLNERPEGTADESQAQTGVLMTSVARAVTPSVVSILVYSAQPNGGAAEATGVILSEDGYLITNDHIYENIHSPQFLITTYDGREYDGRYVAGDKRSDLAVLKVDDAQGFQPAQFGNSDTLQVGEQVITIGNPGGRALSFTVTQGVISGVNRRISVSTNYSMKLIQTDAAISPGCSGGALVNAYGQVVGVNSSKMVAEGYEGISFAIPSTIAKSVAEDLIRSHRVMNRARIGVTYQVVDRVTARQQNIPFGLKIVSILPESDLSGKGFSEGDIITQINGQSITGDGRFLDIVDEHKPGDTLELTIRKSGGSDRVVTVTLIEDVGSSSYLE